MLAQAGDWIVFLLLGIAFAIGTLIKRSREAKARDERQRRVHPKSEEKPVMPASRPQGPQKRESPLKKVRTFFEELQKEAQRAAQAAQGRQPLPSGRRRVVRRVVRRKEPAPAKTETAKRKPTDEPKREGLRERMAEGDKADREKADREKAAERVSAGAKEPAKKRVQPLRAILESQRTHLGKAILLTEILTKPVSLRGSPVPRWRR